MHSCILIAFVANHGLPAVLAICAGRGWLPATDDTDAMRVSEQLLPRLKPLRIRALIHLAAERGLVDLPRARIIHKTMRELGFWDKGAIEIREWLPEHLTGPSEDGWLEAFAKLDAILNGARAGSAPVVEV